MGWLEKAQAAAKIAASEASKLATEAKNALVESDLDSVKTAENKELLRGLLSISKDVIAGAKELTSELIEEAGQTEKGQLIGEGIRELGKAVQKLPGVGLLADSIRARHGIPELVDQLSKDPLDPLKNIQLAESMYKVDRDLKFTDTATGVLHPLAAVARESAKQVSKIGQIDQDPLKIALLKRAFFLARERLIENKSSQENSKNLVVISRVYLALGNEDIARKAAEIAFEFDKGNYSAIFLQGLSAFSVGDKVEAMNFASFCINNNFTLGYQLAADIELTSSNKPYKVRIKGYEEQIAKVTSNQRKKYYGFVLNADSATSSVLSEHFDKASAIAKKVKGDS